MFNKYSIGTHIQYKGSLSKTITSGVDMGMNTFQFFMGNPKSFTRNRIPEFDIKNSLEILEEYPSNVFTHLPYIYNLAGSKNELAWTGLSIDYKLTDNLEEILYELSVIGNFKSGGCVIHPGNHKDRELGCKAIRKTLDDKMDFSKGGTLLLENSAGEGTKLGRDLQELRSMVTGIDNDKHVGFCIDTAHIWGAGQYHIDTVDGVEKMLSDIEEYIGLDKVKLLHLNDSMASDDKKSDAYFGSCKDRHQFIGYGYIFEESQESLKMLVENIGCPIVLETESCDLPNILKLLE